MLGRVAVTRRGYTPTPPGARLTLPGKDGADIKPYQERALRDAIAEAERARDKT